MMKTILLWICAAVMAVSFTSCGNKQTETKLDPELEKQLGTIKTAAEEGAEVGNGVNFPALTIAVSEAKGAKCPRCWMHSEAANEEGLCPRCAAVIAKLDVEI